MAYLFKIDLLYFVYFFKDNCICYFKGFFTKKKKSKLYFSFYPLFSKNESRRIENERMEKRRKIVFLSFGLPRKREGKKEICRPYQKMVSTSAVKTGPDRPVRKVEPGTGQVVGPEDPQNRSSIEPFGNRRNRSKIV